MDEQLGPNEKAAGSSPAGATTLALCPDCNEPYTIHGASLECPPAIRARIVGAWRNVPGKKYRLHDGSLGTEYEACMEALKTLEAKQRFLEEQIELLKLRIQTAEGRHP